jgi:CBS domain-containing protein
MDRDFHSLAIGLLGTGVGIRRPDEPDAVRVTPESPALDVMTDLRRVNPATIRRGAPVEGANQYMISRRVRLLLVVDEKDSVVGVITAADILGERPMLAATERALRRDELIVADIMTPATQAEALALADVEGARVGHIVETLRRAGRQHILVVEGHQDSPQTFVRGIFSLSQIARQLGVVLQANEVARTFAEIEAALGR